VVLKAIGGGTDSPGTFVEDMGVNHCRLEVRMAKKFLNGTDIVAVFQEMSCEAVAEGMAGDPFGCSGALYRLVYCLLKDGFVHVVSALPLGFGVGPPSFLREDPLPHPIDRSAGIFYSESVRQFDPPPTFFKILLMERLYPCEMILEGTDEGVRQHSDPVFVAFSGVNDDLMAFKV